MRFIPFASPSYEKKRRKVNQPALEILATSGCPLPPWGQGQLRHRPDGIISGGVQKLSENAPRAQREGTALDSSSWLRALEGGCSCMSWATRDGKHLWGRNFDFDRIARGTAVTCLPAGTPYFPGGQEGGGSQLRSRYAAVGTGILLIPGTPGAVRGDQRAGTDGGTALLSGVCPLSRPGPPRHAGPVSALCRPPPAGPVCPTWRRPSRRFSQR